VCAAGVTEIARAFSLQAACKWLARPRGRSAGDFILQFAILRRIIAAERRADDGDCPASLKLTLVKLEVRNVAEMNQAFAAAKQANVDAAILLSSPFIGGNTKLAADLMLKYELPAVTLFAEFAQNGGLMSYGPILLDIYRRLGGLAAKVLHGSNPADLPVERPTNFELVVNLKTAKAIGVTIPTSILLQADLVIE
jgi:putative tryptophan/tyrosine transport system substrate-binding protein